MAKVIVKVHVASPSVLSETFKKQAEKRHKHGELGYLQGCDDNHRNYSYFILDWISVASAKAFWFSSKTEALMEEWHAVGKPEITVLRQHPDD